jgi:TRAP-type mannitol/chloroaromatic compound transport system permease small subunit
MPRWSLYPRRRVRGMTSEVSPCVPMHLGGLVLRQRTLPTLCPLRRKSMMRAMLTLADTIDRLTAAIGRAAAWLALIIVVLQFALVVARYLFSLGSIWLSETVVYAHAGLFLLAAAWTLQAGGHVRVDVFYAQASDRRKALIDLVGALVLLLPFALVLAWLSLPYAARSWAVLERSQEASGLPLVFLLKTLIPLFAAMMALQGVAQAIRAGNALAGTR